MNKSPICVIVGAGPGNGAAFARKFSDEGYAVAVLARDEQRIKELATAVPGCHAFVCDVADAVSVKQAFAQVNAKLGIADVLIYNAGSGVFGSIDQVTDPQFEAAWRVNTLGCLQCCRQVIPAMRKRGSGSVIIIGATAAKRGGANFVAFASAKAAQRSLAESLARQLGPEGIHVAYLVIDGVIDIPRTRAFFADRPDDFFLKPAEIAQTVFHLTTQPKSAWTFETDIRPFGEKW